MTPQVGFLSDVPEEPTSGLSGPISRDTAILSLRYPISRDTFSGRLAAPPKWCDTPPWYLVSHKHICAIPHFATYRAITVRYPIKTSAKEFCDTIATSIARYEKYRYWASKLPGSLWSYFPVIPKPCFWGFLWVRCNSLLGIQGCLAGKDFHSSGTRACGHSAPSIKGANLHLLS